MAGLERSLMTYCFISVVDVTELSAARPSLKALRLPSRLFTMALKALFNGHQGSFGVTIKALHNGLKGSFQWPLRLFTLYNGLKGSFALAIKALLQWPLRLFL